MKLDKVIIKMLSDRARVDVTSPSGADFLRHDIHAKTGEPLSLNTVKRLLGILPYDSDPRLSTLDIIAIYLGYENWNILQSTVENKISGFNVNTRFINAEDLPDDCKVIIEWRPGRVILIQHKGEGKYIVLESHNSKLLKGDILTLSQIAVGFPFMVKEVERGGVSLGNYMAAAVDGISSFRIENGEPV